MFIFEDDFLKRELNEMDRLFKRVFNELIFRPKPILTKKDLYIKELEERVRKLEEQLHPKEKMNLDTFKKTLIETLENNTFEPEVKEEKDTFSIHLKIKNHAIKVEVKDKDQLSIEIETKEKSEYSTFTRKNSYQTKLDLEKGEEIIQSILYQLKRLK